MLNSNKIRGRIVEKGLTIQKIAPMISCSNYSLGQKIENKTPMNIEEARQLIDILDISENEIAEYFFYNKGCKSATNNS